MDVVALVKIEENGRLRLPGDVIGDLGWSPGDKIDISTMGNRVFLNKLKVKPCNVTGKSSNHNKQFGPDLILSPEGAEELLKALQYSEYK